MPGWIGLPLLLMVCGLALWGVGVGVVWGWLVRPPRKTPGVALGAGDPLDPADVGLTGEEVSLPLADEERTWAWIIEGRAGSDLPSPFLGRGEQEPRPPGRGW